MPAEPSLPGDCDVVVVGAGFTGLSAALELSKSGLKVMVLESDQGPGGLAGGFGMNGATLEKFYHHWFTSDHHILGLIEELGLSDRVVVRPSRTGMFFANRVYRLSTPTDLLTFSPLRMIDRIRLGWSVLRARLVRDWSRLEAQTARQWLIDAVGERTFRVVWEPLLVGKFGRYADEVGAVWFWKKLVLRGGSRGRGGEEMLAYFSGGFLELAEAVVGAIEARGGLVHFDTPVAALRRNAEGVAGVVTPRGTVGCSSVLATTAPAITAQLGRDVLPPAYVESLERIHYLGNVCLVLILDRSLSDTYWLNVNDPTFPFVGVIEHTNFESAAAYGGKHVVYLSRYLTPDDPMFHMSRDEGLAYAVPHLRRMFPEFDESWIEEYSFWKARYAQPIIERNYSALIPARQTPLSGLFVSSMAHIYPEDRGTNYAVREGRGAADLILAERQSRSSGPAHAASADGVNRRPDQASSVAAGAAARSDVTRVD